MTPNPIKCPGCGREVEFVPNLEGQDACPHCGSSPAATRSTKFNWLIFLGVLLAPAMFALWGSLGKIEGLAVGSPLVGGGLAGLLCGIYLGRRVGRTSAARLWLGFSLSILIKTLRRSLGSRSLLFSLP